MIYLHAHKCMAGTTFAFIKVAHINLFPAAEAVKMHQHGYVHCPTGMPNNRGTLHLHVKKMY